MKAKTPKPSWNDPHAEREAGKYDNPVPSRELILATVQTQGGSGMTMDALIDHFQVSTADQMEALRRRLAAMLRDGQMRCNRRGVYSPLQSSDLVEGRVKAHPDGFGFLQPRDGSDDLFLVSREMRQVFDGDVIQARVVGFDHKGRREASIIKVLERHTANLVGRFYEEDGIGFVVPDNPRFTHEISLRGGTKGAGLGQFVEVKILDQPSHRTPPIGEIVAILGDFMAPGMEIDIAIRSHGIPHRWPEAVEQEATVLSEVVAEQDKEGREDVRDLPLVTIDGEDAKDFDDAVYVCRRRGGGFRLVVAIADVSHYVRERSALDQEAAVRGNSVYFPGSVVPMLPEVLSNGLCSLKPHVDRLCMVCDMTISRVGRVTGYRFYAAVMHSQARLTYTQVGALLANPDHADALVFRQKFEHLVEPIKVLYELYKALRAAREERGALDFEAPETRILFSSERKIERIIPVVRNDAHKLIEECMLAANVCAAEWALQHKLPVLYRNHQGPRDEKLTRLRAYLTLLGLVMPAREHPSPEDFHALLKKIQGRPDQRVIETMLLRSLSQAFYGAENLGHFGLHYAAYAHFTSPIRRYPDLLLHRALRAHDNRDQAVLQDMHQHLPAWGEQCSMTERRADEATRDVVAWLKCEYMQDRIGEDFDGTVTAVTAFGLFVELSDIFVEGLVHISQMGADYYVYDAVSQKLQGEMSGLGFSLGDGVRVKVAGVDLDQRKIDFQLLSSGKPRTRRARKEKI